MGESNRPETVNDDILTPVEEQLFDLLISYEMTLNGQQPGAPNPTAADAAPEVVHQFEETRHVLDRLARLRPAIAPGDAASVARRISDISDSWTEYASTTVQVSANGEPQRAGRFTLLRELGRGGLGVVFLAHDPLLHRRVALKIPRPEALFTPDLRKRFAREAQAAARLTHPNLVAVYEVGEAGLIAYIAAAYCAGPNLANWLAAQQSPVAPNIAAEIVAQLADGIDYAHAQGVLHRDLKPSNVLLEPGFETSASFGPRAVAEFTPKITDFGLARVEDLVDGSTRSGLVMGTPNYMAPEQAEGRADALGPATDVYGLGAILYELLTNRPPFRGANDTDTLHRLVYDEVDPPHKLRPDVPRDLEAICLKCLEKAPAGRYTSAAQLAADLRRFLIGAPTEARPIGGLARVWKWTRRRPATAALLGVSVLAAAALVIGSLVYSATVTAAYRLAEENRLEADTQRHEADIRRNEAETQRSEAVAQRREAEQRRAETQSLVAELRREVYVQDMGRALQIWSQGDPQKAVAVLDKYRPQANEEDLRGFEWYHLQRRFKDQGQTLLGHVGAIYQLSVSPDGKLIATGGADRRVLLWDTDAWKLRTTLPGHTGGVNWTSFSPDGARLVSAADDGTVRLWPLPGRKGEVIARYDDRVAVAAFAPDGETLVVATRRGRVSLLDTQSWSERASMECLYGRPGQVESLAISPDGKEIAISYDMATTELWDLTSAKPHQLKTPPEIERMGFRSIAQYSHVGKNLFMGATFGILAMYSRESSHLAEITSCQLSSAGLDVVVAAPDGYRFATAGSDGVVRVVDGRNLAELQTYVGHRDRVKGLGWLPDGSALVSASDDGRVKVWHPHKATQSGEVIFTEPRTDENGAVCVGPLTFSADGGQLWFATRSAIWCLDVPTAAVTQMLSAQDVGGELRDATFAIGADAPRALIYASDGSRGVWDLVGKRVIMSVPTNADQRAQIQETPSGPAAYLGGISPEGNEIVVPDPRGEIDIWSVDGGRKVRQIPKHYANAIFNSRYAPTGKHIAVNAVGGNDVFDVATGSHVTGFHDTRTPAFSPNKPFLLHAAHDRGNRIRLLSLNQNNPQARDMDLPRAHEHVVAITHDRRTFATVRNGDRQREVCFWNTATGHPIVSLAGYREGEPLSAAFSPDDSLFAALTISETETKVRVWRSDPRDTQMLDPDSAR